MGEFNGVTPSHLMCNGCLTHTLPFELPYRRGVFIEYFESTTYSLLLHKWWVMPSHLMCNGSLTHTLPFELPYRRGVLIEYFESTLNTYSLLLHK